VRDRLVFPIRGDELPEIVEVDFREIAEDVQAPAEDVQHSEEDVQEPAEDFDESSEDFEEAAAVLNKSPRAAAALIRICIQNMMPLLKETGKNLDENISSLVRKGLEVEIQQAMDVLQVIRRNPGQESDVDLRHETAIATRMLESLKEILERPTLKKRGEK
jgi:hypothetical protein